jgi:hypothetical protein
MIAEALRLGCLPLCPRDGAVMDVKGVSGAFGHRTATGFDVLCPAWIGGEHYADGCECPKEETDE